jgi:hypothetical protein
MLVAHMNDEARMIHIDFKSVLPKPYAYKHSRMMATCVQSWLAGVLTGLMV